MLQVRDCRLSGLGDLAIHLDYVKDTLRTYLEDLLSVGVTGKMSHTRHTFSERFLLYFLYEYVTMSISS